MDSMCIVCSGKCDGFSTLFSVRVLSQRYFLVSHDGLVALPRDAIGLSAICDCGLS